MKNDILHSGKLSKVEREHIYQIHLNKIHQIAKKRKSELSLVNEKFLPTYPSSYKIEQELRVKEENDRLVKRLNQISNRKRFQILTSEEDFHNSVNKYVEQQKKYNQKYRHLREKTLQEENQKIVQKLLDKRKNERSKEEFRRDDDDFFMLKKSRSKKRSLKKRQISLGSQEKSRISKNQSQMEQSGKKKSLKAQTQRKRNYSTLLPTIQKVESENKAHETVDHGQLLGLLKKYDGKNKEDLTTGREQGEKYNNISKSEENYETVFESQEEISKTKSKKNLTKLGEKLELPQQSPKPSQNPEQSTSPLQIAKRQVISYSEPLKGYDPMDPSLKFEKMKKNAKTKKRQVIDKVKEENEYENEAFQVDIANQ